MSPVSDLTTIEFANEEPTRGSALVDFLYPTPAKRAVGAIFKWWEKRRLAYNAIVGAGGAVSMSAIALADKLQGGFSLGGTVIAAVAVMVMANLCYTLGPLTEAILHKLWGRDVRPVGPHLFRAGLIFSVGLTFVLPMILTCIRLVIWMLQGF